MKPTYEQLTVDVKKLLHAHLTSVSIIKANADKREANQVMKDFHEQICYNNPMFPSERDTFSVYAGFVNWLQRGEHNESTYNTFNHIRAFKTFWNESNRPAQKYYEPPKSADIPLRQNHDSRRKLNLSVDKLKRTIEIMEWMDEQKPTPGSIASKMSTGKKWTQFSFYKDAKYTLEERGI
jgi:hypothetical protein